MGAYSRHRSTPQIAARSSAVKCSARRAASTKDSKDTDLKSSTRQTTNPFDQESAVSFFYALPFSATCLPVRGKRCASRAAFRRQTPAPLPLGGERLWAIIAETSTITATPMARWPRTVWTSIYTYAVVFLLFPLLCAVAYAWVRGLL